MKNGFLLSANCHHLFHNQTPKQLLLLHSLIYIIISLSLHLFTLTLIIFFKMRSIVCCRQVCMFLALFSLLVLVSEASRFPQVHWEQMLPKKLPIPSSSPSKGTNSISKSSSTSSLNTNSLQSSFSSNGKV